MAQTAIPVKELRGTLKGAVIMPGDPEYDQARTGFSGLYDRRPSVIIRAANADDVAAVVHLARDGGLELAIRSGGHSGAGHSCTDGGIVLDLCAMKGLTIDAAGHTAWAQTGLTAGQFTMAAGAHRLAVGFGDTGSVGIGGLTLGGGVGYLVRRYGLTIDDLLAAEIVTADGRQLRVDDKSHPDLFWAIRGGGGNFGVATRFQFRLHHVDMIAGGMLMLPATPATVRSFIELAEAAPEELSTIANVMKAPALPFVPSEYHGQVVIMGMLAYAGDPEIGLRVIEPFRKLATPITDMVRPMHYPEIYPPDDPKYHPIAENHSMFLDGVDDRAAEAIVGHLQTATAQMVVAQIRILGGAMARIPDDATAFAHRGRRMLVTLAALVPQRDQAGQHHAWLSDFAAALHQHDGVYVNFLVDEGAARVREAYPGPTWERLTAVKARYDPTNLFRLNQNIPPA